jgi:hypothetical protein
MGGGLLSGLLWDLDRGFLLLGILLWGISSMELLVEWGLLGIEFADFGKHFYSDILKDLLLR